MKQKNIETSHASQIKQAQEIIISALSTANIKTFCFSYLQSLRPGPNRYSLIEAAIGAGVSQSSVQRSHNKLFSLNLLNWKRRYKRRNIYYFAPFLYWSPIKRWLIRWLSNCLKSFGYLDACKRRELALNQDDHLDKYIKVNTGLKPGVTGTPPPPNLTFGELLSRQYLVTAPDCLTNKLSRAEFESILDSRPVGQVDVSRPGDEATTQKYQDEASLKQDEVHGSTQSDTGIYPGDRRAGTDKMGSDQAYRVPASSDRRCPPVPQAQQAGPQPLRSILQRRFGILQSQQPTSRLEESRLPERDVPDAGERSDDHGYEGDWQECLD